MDRHNLRLVIITIGMGLFIGLQRIIPHPPNFTPVLASAIVIPYLLGDRWYAWAVPMLAMLVGDVYWGFHSYMLYTYGALAFAVVLSLTTHKLWLAGVGGCLGFFIITNFGVWLSGYYGYTLSGLLTCYWMAIPFFQNTLLSTTMYGGIFYATYVLLAKISPPFKTS